jgi:hypothetical protein
LLLVIGVPKEEVRHAPGQGFPSNLKIFLYGPYTHGAHQQLERAEGNPDWIGAKAGAFLHAS